MTKTVHTVESIRALLLTNDRAVERGVVAIFKNQTASEQSQSVTCENNGIGFNGSDAFILSEFAKQLQNRVNYRLSFKQMEIARKKIVKYSKQLLKIAIANANAKAA